VCMCLSVGGLNEYKEYMIDLCQTIKILAQLLHVALVVSSWPSNIIKNHFSQASMPKVSIQNLTRRGNKKFATACLQAYPL
jgi:hypothetical protein